MSGTTVNLQRKIRNAGDLASVVHTMKVLAASSISQYERAVSSLDEYYRAVQLGLVACLRQDAPISDTVERGRNRAMAIGVLVFGSDQGLVGQFNDDLADYVAKVLHDLPGPTMIWAVGERVQLRLASIGLVPHALFGVPNSINAVTPLIGRILMEIETQREQRQVGQVLIFHNRLNPVRCMNPLINVCYRWTKPGAAICLPSTGLPKVCLRCWVGRLFFGR